MLHGRQVAVAAGGAQPWVNPRGFPYVRRGAGTGARVPDAGAGAGRDAGHGARCGRWSGAGVAAASGR